MSEGAIILRIVIRWFLVALACSAVVCLFWNFACAFTQRRWCKIAFVGILISISVTAYVLNHRTPKVHRMQEGVIYIKPNSE